MPAKSSSQSKDTSQKSKPRRPSRKYVKLSYSVKETVKATGVCRSLVYKAMQDGSLKAKKLNGKTIIPRRAIWLWINALPDWQPQDR